MRRLADHNEAGFLVAVQHLSCGSYFFRTPGIWHSNVVLHFHACRPCVCPARGCASPGGHDAALFRLRSSEMKSHFNCASPIVLSVLALAASSALADVDDRPFDFTDEFYLSNGVNPAAIVGRPEPDGKTAVIDDNVPGPHFRNVRLLEHTAMWDHSGHITYFHVVGLLFPNAFTNDVAGQEALE